MQIKFWINLFGLQQLKKDAVFLISTNHVRNLRSINTITRFCYVEVPVINNLLRSGIVMVMPTLTRIFVQSVSVFNPQIQSL